PVPTEAPEPTETVTDPAPETDTEGDLAVGTWAVIGTDDQNGVQLRAGSSAESDQTGFAPHQGLVEILDGPENGWYEIRWDQQVGWIDGSLLTSSDAPQAAPSSASEATDAEADDVADVEDEDTDAESGAAFQGGDQ